MLALTAFVVYRDYQSRPGLFETTSLKAVERGSDHITLEWNKVRNVEKYVLFYKQKGRQYKDWSRLALDNNEVTEEAAESTKKAKNKETVRVSADVEDLEEGTRYVFMVRPDSDERKGFLTGGKSFETRRTQKVKARDEIMKLSCSKPFKLSAKAETPVQIESEDPEIAEIDKDTGKVVIKRGGSVNLKLTAVEDKNYVSASKKVKLRIIESTPVNSGGAKAYTIYHVNSENCEVVKSISGAGSAVVPQSFGYTGDKYIVAYGMSGSQRIVTFDVKGDGKSVSVPGVALGHPNGFCYSDSTGLCYCVKGWSGRCVTYNPESGNYGVITLPVGCSGIAYDRKDNKFYTSSRTSMVSFSGDGNFSRVLSTGVVSHYGHTYTQDCGGHAGIMMRCLSGSNKHGINYVDLYDMRHGKYLGSISCDLSEVESAVCDKDGYMLLLCNTSDGVDYIWKTDINIEDIGEGLGE